MLMASATSQPSFLFPPEWITAALVQALLSAWVVIGVFLYLNRFTRKPYFNLWTVAWMLYSVYLVTSLGVIEESSEAPFLIMMRRACIGLSALFMFWGTFQLIGQGRRNRELVLASVMMVLWACVAAYQVHERLWITLPVFGLLTGAACYTGVVCIRQGAGRPGANILGVGFILWGLHLLAVPLLDRSAVLLASVYLSLGTVGLLISVGMVAEYQHDLAERAQRVLFDAIRDALVLVDERTSLILDVNPAACRLLGQAAARLIGQNALELFPELRNPELRASGGPQKFRLLRPEQTPGVYEASLNRMLGQHGVVLLIQAREINAEEQAVAEAAVALAPPRQEVAASNPAAYQSLMLKERLKTLEKALSNAVHDFNNVLAKIVGIDELLLEQPDSLQDRDKVWKHLQLIRTAADSGVAVVDRLRELGRHRRREPAVHDPTNLNRVIEEALVMTQPRWTDGALAGGAQIRILKQTLPNLDVRGNPTELQELLANLILNAVEAMPRGGTIAITAGRDANQALLEVSDTGAGMTADVKQRCTEAFFTTKRQPGRGLGLAIVTGIVQRHSGTLTIRSEANRGTTVAVWLPAAPVAVELPAAVAVDGRAPRALRVLVAEDEALLRGIETEYLHAEGCHVEVAANGREALEKFRADRFDLVLTDRSMPVMDGEELAEAIKNAARETPVILMTGCDDLIQANEYRLRYADLVIPKPFTQSDLRHAMLKVTAAINKHVSST